MKTLNIIKLSVELNLRRIAYFIGISSIILWFLMFIRFENNDYEFSEFIMNEFSYFTSVIQITILTSIFILVATRKFKEIKHLIKEID